MEIALFMYIFLLPLTFFFFFFILLRNKISNNGNHNLLPPGPPAVPIIGHLHMQLFDNSSLHMFLRKLSQKYGPLMSLRFGFKQILVVSSAKMAQEVLKIHDLDFCSRPNLCATRKLSYNFSDIGFSPYTEHWREMKKICVVHLFSRVQKYRPIREDEVARLVEKICRSSVDSKPVNLSEAMTCFSSSIICRTVFGKRNDDEGAKKSRLTALIRESEAIVSSFSFSDHFPSMGWVDRYTGFLTRLDKTFKELNTFYQELIDEHLEPNRLKPQQEDIIDVLLRIRTDSNFAFDLTIDHIKAILMDLFLAGLGSTAIATIWVMNFLMKNPECLKKAQAEVRSMIGKKGFVNEYDVQGLTYLKAAIKETFRLQPPTPLLLPRESLRNCNIDGYEVPAKTLVYVNAYAIGRDPETWDNPEEFCPERFIDSSCDYKGVYLKLIPFGAGRRVCPGMRMGVAATELALANLVYKFDWEMPTGMNRQNLDCDAIPGLSTHKKNDLILVASTNIDG